MRDMETTVTKKGQVTIPLEVRRAIGLKPQDRVRFQVEGQSVRIIRAPSRIRAGYGAVAPIERPEDYSEVREEFERGVAEEADSEG